MNVQPQQDGTAKAYQVRQFLKLIAEYNLQLDTDDDEKTAEEDADES